MQALPAQQVYVKINVDEDQQQYVRYASQISNNDLDFLATLEAESGLWTPDRRSNVVDASGNLEPSYGFCQIHAGYHPEVVNDPRFFSDPFWQLDQCWKLYSGGTRFYGADHRHKHKHKFILQ
jgi:hypothetical protein